MQTISHGHEPTRHLVADKVEYGSRLMGSAVPVTFVGMSIAVGSTSWSFNGAWQGCLARRLLCNMRP